MINLKKIAVEIQRLENSAAEKIGMRLLLMQDDGLFGKGAKKFIAQTVDLMIKDCEDEIREAALIGRRIAAAVAGGKPGAGAPGNEFIVFFKIAASMAIEQMADRLRVKIARNKVIGVESGVIEEWRADPKSILNIERFNLTKALKREMAGVLNRIFQAAYIREYR